MKKTLIAISLLLCSRIWADTLYVDGVAYSKIQSAINDANEGDVVIVSPGVYYENISFNGKNITVTSTDPNNWDIIEQTVIDGNNLDSVVIFELGEDANCVLAGFTITNGIANSLEFGGGIRVRFYLDSNSVMHPAGPTIRNNLITYNMAEKGAGISLYHSTARVLNNRIVNNYTTEFGQGGGMMIVDCQEEPNAIIANNVIVGNSALYGGGIRIVHSDVQTTNNLIAYNRGTWAGMGIYGTGEAVVNCILWGNGDDLYQCSATYCCIEDADAGEGNIADEPNFVNAGYWDDANTPGEPSDDFFVFGNYHLLPGSACIDAGDNNSVPEILIIDMDGEERIFSQAVDIGPDEVLTNPADFNADGIVDYFDADVLFNEWLTGGGGLQSDLHQDNFIDLADYAELAYQWLWEAGWHK
jgi:hypothetical protein